MRLLKAILSFAVEEHGLPENPAAKLKLDADGERDVVPDLDAYERLWAAIEKLRGTSYTMGRACDCIALIALTGARRGEIKDLRWRHVDLPGRRLVLARDEHKAGRKTGKTRIIGLPADAAAILTTYLPKEGEKFPDPDALVFSGLRPDAPVALQKPWEAIAEEAKLPSTITLHSLRHGVGTLLAAQGKSPAQLAMALGHSQWRTTERYVHAVDKARAELAEQTAALVRPNKLRAVS
jgi:integrase